MSASELAAIIAAAPASEGAIGPMLEAAAAEIARLASAASCEFWLWRPTPDGDRALTRVAGHGRTLPPEATGSDWVAASNASLEASFSAPSNASSATGMAPLHAVVDGVRIEHMPLGAFGYLALGWSGADLPGPGVHARLRSAVELLAGAVADRLSREDLADANRWLIVRSELDRRIARSFANVSTLTELGKTIEDVCDELFPVEYSGIYFLDPVSAVLRLAYAKGLTEDERRAAESTAMLRHPGVVMRTGVLIDSPEADLEPKEGPNAVPGHGRPVKSRLFLPVRAGGRVVGTIGFAASHRHAFNSRHRQALAFLAEFAGLTYARLAAQIALERRGKLLEATAAAVERLHAVHDWRGAATAALAILGNALDAGTFALIELAPRDLASGNLGSGTLGLASLGHSSLGHSSLDLAHAQPLEFAWQPVFGVPWLHGWRIAHANDAERATLAADRSIDLPLEASPGGPRVQALVKPVLVEGQLWGALVFEPRDERVPAPDRVERSAMRSLAAAFAAAISRERLDATLRDRQKMEAVGRLASGIAHDFNNLLWPIVLYSEMLERTPGLDERAHEMLADMQQAARRAGELVQQVLAISRRRDRVLELVHIAEVVASVGQIAARMAPPGIEVACATDPDAGHILGDAGAFHEAMMHLASNALEAMQGRSGKVELLVDRVARGGREWVRVEMRDEGPGIPEEIRARLFDPYFAADPVRAASAASRTRRHGLGLEVVRRVVAEMEGRIVVAAGPERGTAFEILLPVLRENEGDPSVSLGLADDAPPAVAPGAVPFAGAATVQPNATAASPGGERVLLVDDDPSVLEVAEQMLASLGYEVVAARSGVDALVHLQNLGLRFALLLTDLTMPGMDGIELAREARKLRPGLPVVCCTGFGNERTERRAFEAGMSAFLRKPIDFDSYATTVRAAIDGAAGR